MTMNEQEAPERAPALWQLVPGASVVWNTALYDVVSIDDLQRVQLRHLITGERVVAPVGELLPMGASLESPPVGDVDPAELARACTREKALRPFVLCGERLSAAQMSMIKEELGLKESQIRKLMRQLARDPVPLSIVRRARGRRRNCRMLPKPVESIVRTAIIGAVRGKKTVSLSALNDEVTRLCGNAGQKAPHRQTLARRVSVDGPELRFRRRLGPQRARERVRAKPGVMKTSHALAQVQIDHSPLDLILVDSIERLPIGRGYVTWVMDIHTRAVLGICVSLEPPSSLTAALALVHAMLPKDSWLAERGLSDIEWPMYGKPTASKADNAAEFKGNAYITGCHEWGITPEWRNPGAKEQGAFVERLIGTFQRKAEVLPGATGASAKQRRGYDPAETACMTLQESEIWLVREIVAYHRDTHRTLQMAPGLAWRQAHETPMGLQLPGIVTDRRRLLLDFLPLEKRRVTAVGISFKNNRYWAPALRPMVGLEKRRPFRYDPRDMSKIYVQTLDGHYVDVPLADPTQPAQSLWEMKAVRSHRARLAREAKDPAAREQHLNTQHALISSARRATRQRRQEERKRLGQRDAVPPESTHAVLKQTAPSAQPPGAVDYSEPPEVTPLGGSS